MYSFYYYFEESKKLLKKEALVRQTPWFPWEDSCIETGVLERDYARHMLKNEKWIQLVKDSPYFGISNLSDFGLNAIKYGSLSIRRLEHLREVFENFQSQEIYSHSFVLG